MSTIKPYLDQRTPRKSNLYPLFLIVQHEGRQRFIKTGFKIQVSQWAKNRVVKHPDATFINARVSDIINEANRHFADCLLNNKPARIDLIGTGRTSYSFPQYIEHRAQQLKEREMVIMYKKFNRLAKEIRDCFGDISFSEMKGDKLRTLEQHMIKNGNAPNTRNKKFKMIGEIYGQGIAEGKADGLNPFKEYSIKTTPVKKEKLTVDEIKKIENCEVFGDNEIARDMFLFSYYCKGARFSDVLFLENKSIKEGRVFITAGKTGKHMSIKIHAKLQALIDKYASAKGYLFPLATKPASITERVSISGTWNTIVNRNLKMVAAIAKIKTTLTFHLSRHAFAYHLKLNEANIFVIQESLGHSSIKTTEQYLKGLGDERLDKEMGKLYGD